MPDPDHPFTMQHGPIAIMDALGISMQTDQEIGRFLRAREKVLKDMQTKIEGVTFSTLPQTLTFGDTILVSAVSRNEALLKKDCDCLLRVLRKFLVYALSEGLFFRGVFSIGDHYRNADDGVILGPAIDDAAAWFEQADWIGIHATPHTSLRLEQWGWGAKIKNFLVIDYDIPMKTGKMRLKAVNWPKCYLIDDLSPIDKNQDPRKHVLEQLTSRAIPRGVESKHYNTLEYFDYVHNLNIENAESRSAKRRKNKAR